MKFYLIVFLAVVVASMVLVFFISNSQLPPKTLSLNDLPEGTSHVLLNDGRVMTYVLFGPLDGLPVLFLHSTLHTGRILSYVEDSIVSLNLRVIAVDRPGWGFSDVAPHQDDALAKIAADLCEFLDELQLKKDVALLAVGYGAAYAAAMAHEHPERFSTVIFVNPMAPFKETGVPESLPESQRNTLNMASNYPFTSYMVTMLSRKMLEGASLPYVKGQARAASFDPQLNNTAFLNVWGKDVATSLHRTWHGYAMDLNLISGPWGFSLSGIDHPRVRIFGASFDPMSPTHAMRKYSRGIRGSRFESLEGGSWNLLANFKKIAASIQDSTEPPSEAADEDSRGTGKAPVLEKKERVEL